MSAKPRSHEGAKIIGAILNAQRQKILDEKYRRPISFQEAAKRCGLRSAQHLHRICQGKIPLQYYHLDRVADGLRLNRADLELLWAVGRLLDDRVPYSRLSVLCPRGVDDGRAVAGVAGHPFGPGDGGDARLPKDGRGDGAAGTPTTIDVDLLVRLIMQHEQLAPAHPGEAGSRGGSRFLWLVSRLVSVGAVLCVPYNSIREWLSLIRMIIVYHCGETRRILARSCVTLCAHC